MSAAPDFPPIAIVGLGAMFPGRGTTAGFWRDLVEAVDAAGPVPETHWLARDYFDADPRRPDHTYSRRGAFIPAFAFDPVENGTAPKVVETTDTVQLMALHVARAVLAEAEQGLAAPLDRERVSVVLGVAAGTELMQDMSARLARPMLLNALRADGIDAARAERVADRFSAHFSEWRESTFPGLLGNVVAGRIANRLDLGGVNFTADAACASSLAALRHACAELHEGESDLVLSGGADALNAIFMYMCFSKTPAMSTKGWCSPFSDDADGTLMGEGAGLVALRRLEDAERDGNAIYAVIRGVGAASDGRATSVYSPLADGQARAIRRAYARAGFAPESVGLIEAHGTGTRAGDLAEIGGLKTVFGARAERPWCAIGSVKSQIGHTKSAAGAASLIKCALALHHGVLPPTINIRRPDPRLALEGSPFELCAEPRPWVSPPERPRRAGVSSFGFGGSNFHAALEEYRGAGRRPAAIRALPAELLLVSAGSRAEAASRLAALRGSTREDDDLAAAAAESQDAFAPDAPLRLGLVVEDRATLERLAEGARRALAGEAAPPTGVALAEGPPDPGPIAFLFAGQGSQYVGMGRALAVHFPPARAVWSAHAALGAGDGAPLHRVVFPPTAFDEATAEAQAAALTDTAAAQPALALAELAHLALLDRLGLTPDAVAGHSFGELMALHAAGALDAAAAARLAAARGRAMAAAARDAPGAMLAVMGPRAAVEAALAEAPDLVLANDNAPEQAVLSGPVEAVERAAAHLAARGVRARRLPVATAFHAPIVAPAAGAFAEALARETLAAPRLPVFSNATAAPYPAEPDAAARLLAGQIAAPVRFRETIEALHARGVRTFLELGPAATLTGLVGAVLGDRPHAAIALDRRGTCGVAQLWRALAALAVQGRRLDFAALRRDLPAPERRPDPPKHALMLCGANYNKPYPRPEDAAAPADGATAGESPTPRPKPVDPAAPPAPAAAAPTVDPSAEAGRGAAAQAGPVPPPGSARAPSPPAPSPAPEAGAPASPQAGRQPVTDDISERLARMHEAMAREHGRYLEQVALSHRTFLETGARAMAALTGGAGDAPTPAPGAAPAALPLAPPPAPAATAAPGGDALHAAPAPGGDPERAAPAAAEATSGVLAGPAGDAEAAVVEARPTGPGSEAAPAPGGGAAAATGASEKPDPGAAPPDGAPDVFAIVAGLTGYPVEMLEPEMELEADLGIDSIKQVEILSAMQEAAPALAGLSADALGEVRTLADVAGLLESRGLGPDGGGRGAEAAPAGSASFPAPAPTVGATAAPDIPPAPATARAEAEGGGACDEALLLEVVAELTGYPAEMLDPEMELEADLGIDSIKQVEILSALAERRPEAARIAPDALGEIRTLRDVIDALAAQAPTPDAAVEPPAARAAPNAAASGNAAEAALDRFVVDLAEAPPAAPAAASRELGAVEITAEAPEMAEALAAAFASAGREARVVPAPSGAAAAVVVTAGLSTLDPVAAARAALEAAVAAAPAMRGPGALFVALQDTGGDFARAEGGLAEAARGAMTGLAKTAALEWPEARARALDLAVGADPEAAAARAVREILSDATEPEIGLPADGRRLVPVLSPAAPSPAPRRAPPDDGFIVASGGARGVTAAALRALCAAGPVRLLLLGRSALAPWPETLDPALDRDALVAALGREALAEGAGAAPREIAARADRLIAARAARETLAALEAAGAEVRYAAVDVADAAAVAEAVEARRAAWGPVRGIVHGAGLLADRLIRDRDAAALDAAERVLSVKIRGLEALIGAAGDDAPAFVALFSSVAARHGNPGQADYAMANEALNRMAWALARRWPEARVSAVNWGPWDGGMIDDALRAHFLERGAALIPLEAGASAFVADLLGGSRAAVETVVAASGAGAAPMAKAGE